MRRVIRLNTIAIIAAVLLVFAAVSLNKVVRQNHAYRTMSIVETFAGEFAARLEEKLRTQFAIIDLLRQEWDDGRINTPADFGRASVSVQSLFPDIQAPNWVNPDGIVAQVTPLKGNEPALGLNLLAIKEPAATLKTSTRMNSLRLTPPIALA